MPYNPLNANTTTDSTTKINEISTTDVADFGKYPDGGGGEGDRDKVVGSDAGSFA